MPISLPVDDEANELLTSSALALLIAMLLDQQIPLERAFSAPRDLWARLGHEPTAEELADYNPEALAVEVRRAAGAAPVPEGDGGADPGAGPADRRRLRRRRGGAVDDRDLRRGSAEAGRGLPGFGQQKAKIFVALLGKQLGVRPPGWREAAGVFGAEGSYLSVADIVDDESLGKVRSYKQALKAAAKAKAAP